MRGSVCGVAQKGVGGGPRSRPWGSYPMSRRKHAPPAEWLAKLEGAEPSRFHGLGGQVMSYGAPIAVGLRAKRRERIQWFLHALPTPPPPVGGWLPVAFFFCFLGSGRSHHPTFSTALPPPLLFHVSFLVNPANIRAYIRTS